MEIEAKTSETSQRKVSVMDERQQEFRVGLLAIAAIGAIVVMVFRFGDIGNQLKAGTSIEILLPAADGIHPETPIRMSGIQIGHVKSLELVAEGRGVLLTALIEPEYTFRNDSIAQVSTSLLGDGALNIVPGQAGEAIKAGDRLIGRPAANPMEVMARMEDRLAATLGSFENTGNEWSRLANNLNRMMESSGPDGVNTMQRAAVALEQFTRTMKTTETTLAAAGSLLNDPAYQKSLSDTLTALPALLNQTRQTVNTVDRVMQQVGATAQNLNTATAPLAAQSPQIVARLNQSLGNIESITKDLSAVSTLMNQNDGTVRRLLTDGSLYRNLNSTSASLSVLLQNLKPVVADLQVFSDKVARHPELLGVRGVMRGSDGEKTGDVIPASFRK